MLMSHTVDTQQIMIMTMNGSIKDTSPFPKKKKILEGLRVENDKYVIGVKWGSEA